MAQPPTSAPLRQPKSQQQLAKDAAELAAWNSKKWQVSPINPLRDLALPLSVRQGHVGMGMWIDGISHSVIPGEVWGGQ